MRSHLKWFATGGALLVMTLVAAGVATGKSQATGRELKIGVPLALTGPIAAQATEMVNGYKLYLKQHGGKLGGVVDTLPAARDV
jgi:branched-chain amino acid transport system substrate-binding protein